MFSPLFRLASISSLILLGCAVLLPLSGVHAQTGLGVKVQPSLIEEKVDPGQVIEGVLTVTNEVGGDVTYYVNTRDIVGMSEGGAPQFAEEDAEKTTATWIVPLIPSVTLAIGESAQVPYRITVPTNAEPGSHSAAIFVTKEPDAVSNTGAGVGFNVASLVSLRVSGDVVDDLQLRSFSTKHTLHTTASAEFTIRLENNGNVTQRPQGMISVSNMLGKKVADVTINEAGGGLLPHSERVFTAPWSSESFALGRYTAMLSVVYGDQGRKTITREVSFWVVPVKELGVVLGALVVLLLMMFAGLRAYVRKELRRAGHTPTEKSGVERTFAQRLSRTILWLIVIIVIAFAGVVVFFQ